MLCTVRRFTLVVTDQNKITGVLVVVVAQTGETPQLTGTGTGSPNKNVVVACCNSSATATFFLGHPVYDTQRIGKE